MAAKMASAGNHNNASACAVHLLCCLHNGTEHRVYLEPWQALGCVSVESSQPDKELSIKYIAHHRHGI